MKKNICFFYNTIAEYRRPFFESLGNLSNLTVCLTDAELSEKIYGTKLTQSDRENYKILYVPKQGTRRWISTIISDNKFDLVVIPAIDDLWSALVGYTVSRISKRKCIKVGLFWEKWTPNKDTQPTNKYMKNMLQSSVAKLLLRDVDYCWCPGMCTKKYLLSLGVPTNKIYKIHNTSLAPVVSKNVRLYPNNKIKLLYFGRLIKRKGLNILLESLHNLNDSDFYLVIAGDGPDYNYFKSLSDTLNLDNVKFVGNIPPKDRYTFFNSCDIFILPSINDNGVIEAWGLTLNEALQCHKYIISTDAVGSAYELIKTFNGEIIKNNNIEAMTNALLNAKTRYNDRNVLIESTNLLNEYNYENMASDILEPFKI